MWYCEDCNIEITKYKRNRHLLSARHQKNKGENPYLNGKIYKIICLDDNDDRQYIGSTIIPLHNRLQKHKNDKKEYEEGKEYSCNCASYPLLHNCEIQLIEDYPCINEVELKKREQYHIYNNECININRAFGVSKYQMDKEYREKNKEKIKAHKSKVVVCECGLTYTHCHKTRHYGTKRHQERMEKKII